MRDEKFNRNKTQLNEKNKFFLKNNIKSNAISKFENLKIEKEGVHLLPLGGTGEFGLNLNMYECDGKWIMLDCGVMFDDYSNVNVFMPKIDFIKTIPKENFLGIIITHGHEDHLGAVQYLWKYLKKDVYTTAFTASLLRKKIKDMRGKHEANLHEIKSGETIELGPFSIQWANVTHSIPDNAMILIRTKYGNILHTGDWRFDESPTVGEKSDMALLEKFGKENVLAIVCDSTNAMNDAEFASEEDVKDSLDRIICNIKKGAVVVVCFSSNLSRLDSAARIAQKCGRSVALVGRSLHRIKEVSLETGYLKGLPEFLTEDMAQNCDEDRLLIVCTGSQAEQNSALRRFAEDTHPKITLKPGTTVIISARQITGQEKEIDLMCNKLLKKGIKIITTKQESDIHVSGHPPQGDLKRLYDMMKPKVVIPVHGATRNLMAHREFAESVGYHSILIENGDFVFLGPGKPTIESKVEYGQIGLDGKMLIPRDGRVLMEREWLKSGCIFIGILVYNEEEYDFNIVTSGICEPYENRFKTNLYAKVESLIKTVPSEDRMDYKRLINIMRSKVQNYLFIERGIDCSVFVSCFILGKSTNMNIDEDESEEAVNLDI